MNRRLLPIGIQDFRTIREDSYYYVDKTPLIRQLVGQGRYYFLSRPRRLGKSLLLDTLHELFAGSEPLFRGLDIHGRWDWSAAHPVVNLSFGGQYTEPGAIERDILDQLQLIEDRNGITAGQTSGTGRLRNLLYRLHKATDRQAVVLVDEYDKPILDVLGIPDLARANRDYLRGFYGVIKDSARHVRFVFVTGISMFSRVSLFSGLNNLRDISLDPRYSTLCGYTDRDLDTVFAPELPGLDREEIREWYNGYGWLGEERVYNPFDILLLFDCRRFGPYWFKTGTPDFLYQTMIKRGVSPLELQNRISDIDLVSTFDVDDVSTDALLFQTGYLTIVSEETNDGETFFTLDYPNKEVRHSLNKGLLAHLGKPAKEVRALGKGLCDSLAANDFQAFEDLLRSFFAGVPYQWQMNPELTRFEAWYAGMLYACFCTIGAELRVEDSSNRGRADMVLLHDGQVFVLEFKMAADGDGAERASARALAQIRERGYWEKYLDRGEPIHLVGVVFGRRERNLLAIRAEHC